MSVWFTGSGYEIKFDEMVKQIEYHLDKNGKLFIGTDSFLTKKSCVFATAICLHGADEQSGGVYFVQKVKTSNRPFRHLMLRILTEVEKTVDTALKISSLYPEADIELHLDISASNTGAATARFSDALAGYAKSTGFSCKLKPYSWAAASVADKHSK